MSNFLGLLQLGTDNTGKPKKNSCSNTSFILYKHAVVTLCHGNVQKVCTVYSNLLCDGIWCSSSRTFTTCSTYSIFGTHQSVHAFSYPCVVQVFLIGTNESNMPICRHMAHMYYTEENFPVKKKGNACVIQAAQFRYVFHWHFTATKTIKVEQHSDAVPSNQKCINCR